MNDDLLFFYLNQISLGDVTTFKKNQFSAQYNKYKNSARINHLLEEGTCIRSYNRNSASLYYTYDFSKNNIKRIQKIPISHDKIPLKNERIESIYKNNNKDYFSEIIDLSEKELIERIKSLENIIKIPINNFIVNGLKLEYKIANTNDLNGFGRIKYLNAIIDFKCGDDIVQKSYLNTDNSVSLFDLILEDEPLLVNNNELVSQKDSEPDICILSHMALFELIYILCFFLYDDNIKNNISLLNSNNFNTDIQLNCPLNIVENSPNNKFLEGTTDFLGYSIREKYIIKDGKVCSNFGHSILEYDDGCSKYKGSLSTNTHTKMLKTCVLGNKEDSFIESSSNCLIIESFSGLYESINPKTLDFNCRLVITKKNKKEKSTFNSETLKLNLLEVLDSIISFDSNYKYVGDGSMLIPCAKLDLGNDLFKM